MSSKAPVVLLAGVPRSSFDEFAPVLDRGKLKVVQVTSAEDAVKFAHSDRVDLVILNAEPTEMSLEEVVRTIRSGSSASRQASLLVLAQPGTEEGPRELIGQGVDRVMLSVDPPKFIALQVASLLDIPPRATMRLSTRMLVELADGSQEVLAAVVNLSAVGLLLETDAIVEPGQFVVFSIDVGPEQEPVSGKAEIVRKADHEHDGVDGIGVRFISFQGDSRERLEAILGRAFHLPVDEIRTTS